MTPRRILDEIEAIRLYGYHDAYRGFVLVVAFVSTFIGSGIGLFAGVAYAISRHL